MGGAEGAGVGLGGIPHLHCGQCPHQRVGVTVSRAVNTDVAGDVLSDAADVGLEYAMKGCPVAIHVTKSKTLIVRGRRCHALGSMRFHLVGAGMTLMIDMKAKPECVFG